MVNNNAQVRIKMRYLSTLIRGIAYVSSIIFLCSWQGCNSQGTIKVDGDSKTHNSGNLWCYSCIALEDLTSGGLIATYFPIDVCLVRCTTAGTTDIACTTIAGEFLVTGQAFDDGVHPPRPSFSGVWCTITPIDCRINCVGQQLAIPPTP
jgi:hypothetical protein